MFEITKREVLASISIIAIMLLIGFLISGKISDWQMDKNEAYNKAVKIDSSEMFEYGMRTNIGNAFVYGTLEAVDTVTYPEIDGKYMHVEKIEEHYTMHTRTVTTTVNGHTQTRVETYWTWDVVDTEELTSKEIAFSGVKFSSDKIDIPRPNYIDTIEESGYVRFKYYGTATKHKGTIFTELKGNTISNNSDFYKDKTIEETTELLRSVEWTAIFWAAWITIIGLCVYGFYYVENRWLE